MQELSWHDIKYFLEVVRCGSVNKASNAIGVNQSTVSRRINSFEESLGVKLFDRTAGTKWIVTAAGERLMASAERMADEVHTIQREILKEANEMSGLVRITIGNYNLNKILLPIVKKITEEHPNIELEIIATDAVLDLATREADLAVRVTNTPPSNLVGQRIGKIESAIYATQDLLDRYKAGATDLPCIKHLSDTLEDHDWVNELMPSTKQTLRTNSASTKIGMGINGMGLIHAPKVVAEPLPELHYIAPYKGSGSDLWVLSHIDLRTTARVRLIRDYLVAALTIAVKDTDLLSHDRQTIDYTSI